MEELASSPLAGAYKGCRVMRCLRYFFKHRMMPLIAEAPVRGDGAKVEVKSKPGVVLHCCYVGMMQGETFFLGSQKFVQKSLSGIEVISRRDVLKVHTGRNWPCHLQRALT